MIKNIFLHASAAKIDGLLADADEDGTNLIRLRSFMRVVKYLLNEPVDTVDEDGEDEDPEDERTVDERPTDERLTDERPADECPEDERPEPALLEVSF
ncbi:unnamed protein product [Rotaria sordida]|uniref:Uncharacterized protein n=1 Tax=Rotaria sordida TaxID=392033 RepID=A0A813U5K0_9BILA|nr:unnamed protein product [Rotaria sordida]CAF0832673.1 unnamed protein product [Rotaria sordida]